MDTLLWKLLIHDIFPFDAIGNSLVTDLRLRGSLHFHFCLLSLLTRKQINFDGVHCVYLSDGLFWILKVPKNTLENRMIIMKL